MLHNKREPVKSFIGFCSLFVHNIRHSIWIGSPQISLRLVYFAQVAPCKNCLFTWKMRCSGNKLNSAGFTWWHPAQTLNLQYVAVGCLLINLLLTAVMDIYVYRYIYSAIPVLSETSKILHVYVWSINCHQIHLFSPAIKQNGAALFAIQVHNCFAKNMLGPLNRLSVALFSAFMSTEELKICKCTVTHAKHLVLLQRYIFCVMLGNIHVTIMVSTLHNFNVTPVQIYMYIVHIMQMLSAAFSLK